MNVVEREKVALVEVPMASLKFRKSAEEASAAVVSKDSQDEVIWTVFGCWVLVPIESARVCEKGLRAWVSWWMSWSWGDGSGEVVMEMMTVIGIAAVLAALTIQM